jgi:hypothetical protein
MVEQKLPKPGTSSNATVHAHLLHADMRSLENSALINKLPTITVSTLSIVEKAADEPHLQP